MSIRVLFDTNVLLDVLDRREPFYDEAVTLWTLAEQGRLAGFVSAVSFTNVYYLVCRWHDAPSARRAVIMLRDTFTVVPCDEQLINQAIDWDIPDFEDAVQYFSAVHASAGYIVSRNVGDFPRAEPATMTPSEFLSAHLDKL